MLEMTEKHERIEAFGKRLVADICDEKEREKQVNEIFDFLIVHQNLIITIVIRGGMFQGGELHLQCDCGGSDSHPLHQLILARSVSLGSIPSTSTI